MPQEGDAKELEERLGLVFNQPALLEQALVHRSFLNENRDWPQPDNERLEFLGDAVLSLVVTETLYQLYPTVSEGELTRLRSELVRQDTLARVAGSLQLGGFLRLGKGEELSGGQSRPSILCCALEAVIAAVYLDRGLQATRDFVERLLETELEQLALETYEKDYKSGLQEVVQALGMTTPVYRTVQAVGPDHEKLFTIEVLAGEQVVGCGTGRSKRQAEKEAARDALEKLEGGIAEHESGAVETTS